MRITRFVAAGALLAAFSFPAFAEDAVPQDAEGDTVSDAVDIAMFCGAAFTVAAKAETNTAEERDASDKMATLAFARAQKALDEDGVEAGEYDRLIKFYVDAAMSDMNAGTENMRYSPDECVAEAQK